MSHMNYTAPFLVYLAMAAVQIGCSSDHQAEPDMSWQLTEDMDCKNACQPDQTAMDSGSIDIATDQHGEVDFSDATPDLEPWNVPDGMIEIPEGTFIMGVSIEDDPNAGFLGKAPDHEVYLSRYAIDRIEVTASDYTKCVTQGACTPPDTPTIDSNPDEDLCNYGIEGKESHPINCVDWTRANDYCAWAGKHLPTEAQWEKAARGTDERLYPWGDTPRPSCELVAAGNCQDEPGTWVAGSHAGDISPYGVRDLMGNVSEWTHDLFEKEYYETSPYENPQGPLNTSSGFRTIRGESYLSRPGFYTETPERSAVEPTLRSEAIGFRCAYSGPDGL